MDRDEIIMIGSITLGIIAFGVFMSFGVKLFENTFVDNVPSIVKVDGKIVYEGTSAGFDTGSEGANTSVVVKGGFLYMFPKAYYVSKNVEVIGKKP